jgi:putative protease
MKGHILNLPQPGSVVGHISPEDLMKTIPRAPH